MSKAIGLVEIDDFLKTEIGKNIHQLKRTDPASPQQENATGEKSADDLGILFRRITERATREIEGLVATSDNARRHCEKTSAANLIIPMYRDRVVEFAALALMAVAIAIIGYAIFALRELVRRHA